jgi:hypothetical protein
MRGQRLAWAGSAAVFILVVFALVPLHSHRGRAEFTHETFNRIRTGMMRKEVTAILGAPPGDYGSVPTVFLVDGEQWSDDEGIISVWFDAGGTVTARD